MKKILIPTDFSSNAMSALQYGVSLASALGEVELTLLHTYEVHSNAGMFVSVSDFMKKDAVDQVLEAIKKVEPRLQNGVTIDSQILRGNTVDLITDFARRNQYDLILMGTQGASGLQEIFFGSTTNAVLKQSEVPVLAVPAGYRYAPVEKIVLAIDEEGLSDQSLVAPLVSISKAYDAPVCVFHQSAAFDRDGIDPSVDAALSGLAHSFHYELEKEQVNESINSFVTDCGAQLLVMVRRQRGFLEEVFHVSATTRKVFSTSIPLLILKEC
ncbi:MAG: universal stress protein [Phaeodactylibacter sp.]|uniref:universal stress protein n=1 Tax=Phaeodactylibacter sp. TaxID=1940289 RepID=UPI0032EDD02B